MLPTAYADTHMVPVKDAGVIILNSYYPMLFDRLSLVKKDNHFASQADQMEAVHYLHYLATGSLDADDSQLALDKILCGVHLTTSVTGPFAPNAEQKN